MEKIAPSKCSSVSLDSFLILLQIGYKTENTFPQEQKSFSWQN